MRLSIVFLLFLFLSGFSVLAQKQTSYVQQLWGGYMNQTRLSERWGVWGDFHLRVREDVVSGLSTGIARFGLIYYVHTNLRLTAGYAFVNHFPAASTEISQPEHRPWQQIQWLNNSNRSRATHALRFEQRYRREVVNGNTLGDDYLFNWRLRYNFMWLYPLSGTRPFGKNTLSFVFNDEIHINFGKEIVNNYFDQNRFSVGFAYHINQSDNIQFAYLNVFQQLPAGNRYRSIHGPRIFYFHNIDLRKK